ncbi:photosynthetic complex putative assembly protein PuhB [Sphingomonas sp. 28-62-11]|uniref:photosynthetic complex putative assembly protein PuhB n=1 Tax=Sphingomonas sp. 28-62-11 TaxID=1970432 RepID=UPI0035A8A5D4
MMTEYENEPVPGLPGFLPKGETMIWQGAPNWRVLARTAFHTGTVSAYFAALTAFALGAAVWRGVEAPSDLAGVGLTVGGAVIGVALLHLLAWAVARSTIYTLTDRRIVMRFGVALPKCINLPLNIIGNVDLRHRTHGTGDLAIKLTSEQRLGYAALWPHARAWHYTVPQPMLRAVPDVDAVATLLARACLSIQTDGRVVPIETATRRNKAEDQAVAA